MWNPKYHLSLDLLSADQNRLLSGISAGSVSRLGKGCEKAA